MKFPRLDKNVEGDFYTTGECLACALPESEAPECLAPLEGDNYDTYFIRQPTTDVEIDNVCSAAHVCCVSAIRYGGRNPTIIERLGNRAEYCDYLVPGGPVQLNWETDERFAKVKKNSSHWWQFWLR